MSKLQDRKKVATRVASNRQEKQVAKRLNGKKQPNSGATPFFKGDVVTDQFLLECKTAMTEKKSMSIKKDWIEKLEEERFASGKDYWAVAFDFGGLSNDENFYIINEELFIKLQNYLQEEDTCKL